MQATNGLACQISPLPRSTTPMVSPAKSTKTFSPPTWLCRMVGETWDFQAP